MNSDDDWLIFQLADSAFPAGGFAHSGGLEAAFQHSWVNDMQSLEAMIRCQLQAAAHLAAPFVAAAHREPERTPACDDFCDASLNNHVANRASRAQGQAFVLAASARVRRSSTGRIDGQASLLSIARAFRADFRNRHAKFGHSFGSIDHAIPVSAIARAGFRSRPIGNRRADGRTGTAMAAGAIRRKFGSAGDAALDRRRRTNRALAGTAAREPRIVCIPDCSRVRVFDISLGNVILRYFEGSCWSRERARSFGTSG